MMLKKILFSLISLLISTASFANDALDDINSTATYRKMKEVMPESEFEKKQHQLCRLRYYNSWVAMVIHGQVKLKPNAKQPNKVQVVMLKN